MGDKHLESERVVIETYLQEHGLETTLKTNPAATPAVYTFEMMKEQFTKADKSGKGMAGPAANSELVLYEFLNVITRVSFYRLNRMPSGD